METNYITLLSLYTAILFAIIFLTTSLLNWKDDKKSFTYTLLFIAAALILLGEYMLEKNPSFASTIIFWHKIRVLGAILLVPLFPLAFRTFFNIKINKPYIYTLSGLTAILIVLLFGTELIISNKIQVWSIIVKGVPGKLYFTYPLLNPVVILYEYINIILNYSQSKDDKKYLLIFIIGTGISVFSGLFDLIGYFLSFKIYNLPSLFTYGSLIMMLSMGTTFLLKYYEALYKLTKSNQQINKLLDKSRIEAFDLLELITSTIEARDKYTAGHSQRVTKYALQIADILKLSDYEKQVLRDACLLHDIGKIGIPESILNKPASLTKEEYEAIKKHPVIGVEILSHFHHFVRLLPYVYFHHERIDGKGYPKGIKGEKIPLLARIIAVADTFDAITSNRPYRKAMSVKKAVKILNEVKGTQLDPLIVSEFVKNIEES